MKTSWVRSPASHKFDGTCNGLKDHRLIFNSADSRADCFTHVKREISEYIGKEYTNGGVV